MSLSRTTLTLPQAVALLKRVAAGQNPSSPAFRHDLGPLVPDRSQLAPLKLSASASETLERIRKGNGVDGRQAMRALAVLACRVGQREEATGPSREEARDVAERLMEGTEFGPAPERSFFARQDPRKGFDPFQTALGTRVMFLRRPDQLGEPWASHFKKRWGNGIGLVLFRNRERDITGMIFLHSVGRVTWTKIRPGEPVWMSSGGSMAFPTDGHYDFRRALEAAIDKAKDMTLKWRAEDILLRMARIDKPTGLAGSKGIFLHPSGQEGYQKGLAVYGEVLDTLGITLTGSDEGIGKEAADFLSRIAPLNIIGGAHSEHGGRIPTDWTARGIIKIIEALLARRRSGNPESFFLQGYGGIGGPVGRFLIERSVPIAGVSEQIPDRLRQARADGHEGRIFRDPGDGDFAEFIRQAGAVGVVVPAAGTHPLTFSVAEAMIEAGVWATAGPANSQLGLDGEGSPEAVAWILQAAGIFQPADFVINLMGAAGVSSGGIGLTDEDMEGLLHQVFLRIGWEMEECFSRGRPPTLAEIETARADFERGVREGLLLDGRD